VPVVAPAPARGAAAAAAEPPWWPVSTTKFVIMTVGTIGLYHYYWLYANWKLVRARGGAVSPLWRTFLAPFTVYGLFAATKNSAAPKRVPAPWGPELLAGAYLIANIAMLIAIPPYLAGVVFLLPLWPVQVTMARVNDAVAPDTPRNDRITVVNFMMLALGALFAAGAFALDREVDRLLKEWEP
jgi:hypothetical protein